MKFKNVLWINSAIQLGREIVQLIKEKRASKGANVPKDGK